MSSITISSIDSHAASLKTDKTPIVTVTELEVSDEENERTFHNTDSAYVLPNDNIEHQRLEFQHQLFHRFLGNKIFHAPLDSTRISKTLDIGCGTGVVTDLMASTFPAAQVYGADLSPVPQVRKKLPNITYIQGNIMEIEDQRFAPQSFDLIFSRLLILGMTNWQAYISRCVSLARPGGWIEMHDFSQAIHTLPSHVSSLTHLRPHTITLPQLSSRTHTTDTYSHPTPWLWESSLQTFLSLKGGDIYCGSNIPFLFAEAGLQDITVQRYMVPCSRWEGLTVEEQEMAEYIKEVVLGGMMPVGLRKAGENAGVEYAAETEEAVRDLREFYEGFEEGRKFMWFYVVCGRKAEGM